MQEEGLYYPFEGDDWIERLLIGGVLGIFWFLIVPALALGGYVHRVLEGTLSDAEEPPAFGDWEAMISDGVEVVLVSLVYALVPLLVAGAIGSVLITGGGGIESFLEASGIVTALLLILAVTLVYYLLAPALTNMVREDDVDGAFDYATLSQVWSSGTYLVAALAPIALVLLAHFLTLAVYVSYVSGAMVIAGVGVVVVPIVQFYVHVAIFRMFGIAFETVTAADSTQATPAATVS